MSELTQGESDAIEDLLDRVPELKPFYDLHLVDWGGVLSHMLIYEAFDRIVKKFKTEHPSDRDVARRFMEWVEAHIQSENGTVVGWFGIDVVPSLTSQRDAEFLIELAGPKTRAAVDEQKAANEWAIQKERNSWVAWLRRVIGRQPAPGESSEEKLTAKKSAPWPPQNIMDACEDLVRRVPELKPIYDDSDWWNDFEDEDDADWRFIPYGFLAAVFRYIKSQAQSDAYGSTDIVRRYLEWVEEHIDSPDEYMSDLVGIEFAESVECDLEMWNLIRRRLGPKCMAQLRHLKDRPPRAKPVETNLPWYKDLFRIFW